MMSGSPARRAGTGMDRAATVCRTAMVATTAASPLPSLTRFIVLPRGGGRYYDLRTMRAAPPGRYPVPRTRSGGVRRGEEHAHQDRQDHRDLAAGRPPGPHLRAPGVVQVQRHERLGRGL